jgi:hypothetical protein
VATSSGLDAINNSKILASTGIPILDIQALATRATKRKSTQNWLQFVAACRLISQ